MTVSSRVELVPDDADATSYYRQTDVNDIACAVIKVVPNNGLSGQLIMQTRGGMAPVAPPRGLSNYRAESGEWWFWVSPKVTNIMFTCDGYTATDWIGVSLQSGKVYRLKLNVDSSVTILQNFTGTGLSGVKMTITPKDATVYYGVDGSYSLGSQTITDGFFDIFLDKGIYYFKIESDYYETWFGTIEISDGTNETTVSLKPAFGLVTLDSNPQGARVLLDGKPIGVTPIHTSGKITSGKHVLRLEKDNYYAWEESVVIEPSGKLQKLQTINLSKQFGTATILCDDKDATLIITNPSGKEVARGKSGLKVNLNSLYTYKLEATKPSHAPQSKGISGKAIEGKDEIISIGAPAPMYGGIAISSVPSRADVYIDDDFAGTTALGQQILVGKHKIELKKDGYTPEAFEIEIQHNQTLHLSKELQEQKVSYEWIDLGLPSGIKWATCNLGALKPEDYGNLYAWGETETKSAYNLSTYKWASGDYNKISKYCPIYRTSYWYEDGRPDGKTVLDPEDDAAHMVLGDSWRIPTDAEWTELRTTCTWTWTTENGVNGRKVTGPNGNSIFLPATRNEVRPYGRYWSSSIREDSPYHAWYVDFGSGYVYRSDYNRYYGISVRPVLGSPSESSTTIRMIDLGLSVKWAECNLGASKPEEYGDYYAWGELASKESYDRSSYRWCNGDYDSLTKYNSDRKYGAVDNKRTLELQDDVANQQLGGGWRIPTDAEWDELRTKCKWTWVKQNGVKGRKITGPNGNTIFLPAAGWLERTKTINDGSYGFYWSSTLHWGYPGYAWTVYFGSDEVNWLGSYRYYGQPVRPVSK